MTQRKRGRREPETPGRPTEDQEQAEVVRWANGRPWGEWLFHIQNEGTWSKRRGQRGKALGIRRGVPDLFLPIPAGGYHGLWIEMKRTGGRMSDVRREQRVWIDNLRRMGYRAEVCFGAKDAIGVLTEYEEGMKGEL